MTSNAESIDVGEPALPRRRNRPCDLMVDCAKETSRIHVNPERSFGGTNGEPPSEARQLRKGSPGALPRKMSTTYIANGAIYVIPELYL